MQSVQNSVWAYLLPNWPQAKFLFSVPTATSHCSPQGDYFLSTPDLILSNGLQKGNVRNALKSVPIHRGRFAEVARKEATQTG